MSNDVPAAASAALDNKVGVSLGDVEMPRHQQPRWTLILEHLNYIGQSI